MENIKIFENILGEEIIIDDYSPLMLAYLGDAVFELAVRTHLCYKNNAKIRDVHKRTVKYVNAESQSKIAHEIFDSLDEKEQELIKKGRNTKSHVPKNANATSYRYATGFETLIGYLYVNGKKDRLEEILEMSMNVIKIEE